MKKLFTYLILFSFFFCRIGAFAQEDSCVPEDSEVFYTDIDDELFNRGKFVGQETNDYLRRQKRARNTNWAIALGSTAIGVAVLVFVGHNHEKD